jgi:MFS family permease
VIVQGGLISPLTRRFGEVRLLVAGVLLEAAGLAALPYAGSVPGLWLATLPLAAGAGLAQPSLSALLSRLARADEQGGTLGIGESAAALGRIVGPEAGTFTYGQWWQGFPYVAGAVIMLVSAGIGATLRRPAGATAARSTT